MGADTALRVPLESGKYYQLSRNTVDTEYPLHRHECCEFEFILSGSGIQNVNGVEYDIKKGSGTLLLPSDYHSYRGISGIASIWSLKFQPYMLSDELRRVIGGECGIIRADMSGDNYKIIYDLLEKCENLCDNMALRSGRELDLIISKAAVELVVSMLLRMYFDSGERATAENDAPRRMIAYINSHFRQQLTITDVASYVNMSPLYLPAYFKRKLGVTFNKYVSDIRLQLAKLLLTRSDLSLKHIAIDCGFSSASYFSRVYKDNFGVSPSEARAASAPDYDNKQYNSAVHRGT